MRVLTGTRMAALLSVSLLCPALAATDDTVEWQSVRTRGHELGHGFRVSPGRPSPSDTLQLRVFGYLGGEDVQSGNWLLVGDTLRVWPCS